MLRLANIRNGLPYPHDATCYFQSQYAHHMTLGYFNKDAMPWDAVIHLLKGGEICVIDATSHNRLSDALKYGVPTWCAVFNRAIRTPSKVCDWFTPEMQTTSMSKLHKPTVQTIRKLVPLYGFTSPAVIGSTVHLVCYREVQFDDKPLELRKLLEVK